MVWFSRRFQSITNMFSFIWLAIKCVFVLWNILTRADAISLNGSENVSVSGNSARNSGSEVAQNSSLQVMSSDDSDSQPKCDGPSTNEAKQPVFLDEISSSVDENSCKEEGILDNCGILTSTCLPCLASTVPSVEKRRSLSSSPPSARKKAPLKLPFKWKEGHVNSALCMYCYAFNIRYFHVILVQKVIFGV